MPAVCRPQARRASTVQPSHFRALRGLPWVQQAANSHLKWSEGTARSSPGASVFPPTRVGNAPNTQDTVEHAEGTASGSMGQSAPKGSSVPTEQTPLRTNLLPSQLTEPQNKAQEYAQQKNTKHSAPNKVQNAWNPSQAYQIRKKKKKKENEKDDL